MIGWENHVQVVVQSSAGLRANVSCCVFVGGVLTLNQRVQGSSPCGGTRHEIPMNPLGNIPKNIGFLNFVNCQIAFSASAFSAGASSMSMRTDGDSKSSY